MCDNFIIVIYTIYFLITLSMKNFHRNARWASLSLLIVLIINYTLWRELWNLDEIFPFLIMPPGITFAIAWSTIYWWLILTVWNWRSKRVERNKKRTVSNKYFLLSCAVNIGRIVATYMQAYTISVIVLFILLFILYLLVRHIKKHQKNLHASTTTIIPFSLYLWRIATASSIIWISQLVDLYFWMK